MCLAAAQATIYLCLMDIASGMDYLHSLGVLHGDVKGANVLLRTAAPSPYDGRGFVCKARACACMLHIFCPWQNAAKRWVGSLLPLAPP